jgi:hypothetical protein
MENQLKQTAFFFFLFRGVLIGGFVAYGELI